MVADLFDIDKEGFKENMVAIKTNDGKKRSSMLLQSIAKVTNDLDRNK